MPRHLSQQSMAPQSRFAGMATEADNLMRRNHSLKAGVAGADVTPVPGPPLLGHGGKSSSAGFAPLGVRAIVCEHGRQRAAIITADTLGLCKQSTGRIRSQLQRECGIRPDHVLIAYSHTHCAPGG